MKQDVSVSKNSPLTLLKCIVVYCPEDWFYEGQDLAMAVGIVKSGGAKACENHDFTAIEYESPQGYESLVGRGILFFEELWPTNCEVAILVNEHGQWVIHEDARRHAF